MTYNELMGLPEKRTACLFCQKNFFLWMNFRIIAFVVGNNKCTCGKIVHPRFL